MAHRTLLNHKLQIPQYCDGGLLNHLAITVNENAVLAPDVRLCSRRSVCVAASIDERPRESLSEMFKSSAPAVRSGTRLTSACETEVVDSVSLSWRICSKLLVADVWTSAGC
ncbi:unnamed protein product [Prorocentrum cordatum]|uniref:Uncharacterized protein n=1 Tax=Prorocentrum cordatum TaxID=2364126 RepID=A0ABN9TJK4_9DINO|nr:unnamed protein product [Polarella glacialis]